MVYFTSCVMRFENCGITILISAIICLSLFGSKVGAIRISWNEIDRLALLAFKADISEDPFEIMKLWNDTTHFCQWYGVTCSRRHQRVTELNLISLKLGGSISPHIGNLSFLQVLHLQNNSFSLQIPLEIGRLRRLQVLKLTNNTLAGEIPLNLGNCSKLRSLFLNNNELEGGIPSELGFLSNLQSLSASKNNLIGSLPPSLGNLTVLRVLDFAYNNLVGRIPESLGSLSNLMFLALDINNLSGEVPSSLFNLSSMEMLDIGSNQLGNGRHLSPALFQTLPDLQYFSIQGNQFTGPIPVSLSNASDLNFIQFAKNKFTGKVPSLEKLNMLRVFRVFLNELGSGGDAAKDDLWFLCSLANATSLQFLDISSNNLGGVLPNCISNLSSQLIGLSISGNYISGTIPPGIDNLIGLDRLFLSNNSLTGTIPPTIGNLRNLVILHLSENNLSGPIPSSLGKLSKLDELVMSSNSLEGTIPSTLQNCTLLHLLNLEQNKLGGFIPPQVLTIPSLSIALVLSHNQLVGSLPEQVGKLGNLDFLDVSSNMLSGNIPDTLGECTSMEFLKMDHNNFQGPIPLSLVSMKGLQMVDLSSNNISGQIPGFFSSFDYMILLNLSFNHLEGAVPTKGVFTNASEVLLEGNNKLCGGIPEFHLPACSSSLESKKKKLSNKMKVMIASIAGVGGVVLFVLLFLLYLFAFRWKRRQCREDIVVAPSRDPPLPFLSYGDLHRATHAFSEGNLVGSGSFGHVYRGILGEGGQIVAVKVLNLKRTGASRSFVAECEALRNIRHKNLVKLLTVCSGVDYQGNDFKALVYEFMSNGSLEDWLHPTSMTEAEVVDAQQKKLSLLKRLSIAIDVASLLEYVHHEFGTPLVHCDIKPSNILLDDDLFGHVSDFGIAKFLSDTRIIRNHVHSTSSLGLRGTVGYAPPEYGLGSEVSIQGDVYSYGILLLEMFTGKRPTDEMFKEGLSLHVYAKMALPSTVVEILDPILEDCLENGDQILNPRRSIRVMDCLVSVFEIGVSCSLESPTERMDMHTVSAKLRKVQDKLLRGRV